MLVRNACLRLGESLDKDMIAVRIGPDWRLIAVGSPEYLATHPAPKHPQELIEHSCINQRHISSGAPYAWEFEKELRVRVRGQLIFNTSYAQIDAALQGYGIAYLPESLAAEYIAWGRLVQVLDDWSPMFSGYYLYYPSKPQTSPALAVVVNALRV